MKRGQQLRLRDNGEGSKRLSEGCFKKLVDRKKTSGGCDLKRERVDQRDVRVQGFFRRHRDVSLRDASEAK